VAAIVGLFIGAQNIAQKRPDIETHRSAALHLSYSITLTGPTGPVRIGVPIEVVATFTNETDGDLYWSSGVGKDSVYRAFKFILTKNGHEAPTTFFHRKVSGRQEPGDPHEVAGGSSITLD
jgi:hypothetical protein